MHRSNLCLWLHMLLFPRVSVCRFSATSNTLWGLRTTSLTSSLLDYISKDPISKYNHIHRCQGLGPSLISLQDKIQPITDPNLLSIKYQQLEQNRNTLPRDQWHEGKASTVLDLCLLPWPADWWKYSCLYVYMFTLDFSQHLPFPIRWLTGLFVFLCSRDLYRMERRSCLKSRVPSSFLCFFVFFLSSKLTKQIILWVQEGLA